MMRYFLEDLREFIGILAIVIGIILLFTLLLVGVLYPIDRYVCSQYQEATGRPTKYVALSCYVQDGGTWYKWEEYKHRLVTKGEMK